MYVRLSSPGAPWSSPTSAARRAPTAMKVDSNAKLCMAAGNGENSYATNSRLQAHAILENRPALKKIVRDVCASLSPGSAMVVADLGCSSGPNTLLVVSEVVGAVRAYNLNKTAGDEDERRRGAVEVQFFLNDLPGNDFNLVFRSLGKQEEMAMPAYYVSGLPGSFYTRLFPCQSVHFFHSSYSLMWRSKVPEELSNGNYLNQGNIYIGKTTPPMVVQLLREQFQKDFELFLTLRSKELVSGGQMMLTFLGRKSKEMLMHGEIGIVWELLAKSLQSLVLEGLVEKEKLDSFNLPFYAPSVDEVKALIKQIDLFDIKHIRFFESNWDPLDDSDGDQTLDYARSGENVAKSMRAVLEPQITGHFGKQILDELFMVFSSAVAKHLEKAKSKVKYPIIIVSLKKATQY